MLLRKIDGEMNVQMVDFPWNFGMETVATCSTNDGNGSYHGLAPSFFEEMTRCWRQKQCRRRPDILMVHRNSANIVCPFRFYVCLRLHDRYCCSAADGSGSCHAPGPSYFEEITRCRRKKLDWRWPGNPNGRSKFCNTSLFTFTTDAPATTPQLLEIAQMACNRRQKHRRDDQDQSKFRIANTDINPSAVVDWYISPESCLLGTDGRQIDPLDWTIVAQMADKLTSGLQTLERWKLMFIYIWFSTEEWKLSFLVLCFKHFACRLTLYCRQWRCFHSQPGKCE